MISDLKRLMLTVVTYAVATVGICQWTFSLDTTFRTPIGREYVNSILIHPNGGLVASGVMRFPNETTDKRLVGITGVGTRDESFYNSGLGGGKLTHWNDRFYVGVSAVRRILYSGAQDPSFIEVNTGPYFASIQGADYHVFPDGRVLISGTHQLSDATRGFVGNYDLIWFSNTGYLDTTRTHRRGNGQVGRFAPLPNGQFIGSCTCTEMDGVPVGRIFRFNADGSTDPTFQSGVFIGAAYGYLPLPDGRIYVGGDFQRTQAPDDTLKLVRFMPNGDLDPTFNIPHFELGELSGPFGPTIGYLYPWGDGNVMVTGAFQYVNGQERRGICMIDSTGALLDVFDGCGVGTYTAFNFTSGSVQSVLLDTANNHLYICGKYVGYNDGTTNDTLQRFISRLLVEEVHTAVDERTEELEVALYPNPASGSTTLVLRELPPHGELVLHDAFGRVVLRQPLRTYSTTLYLQTLANGVYTLELKTAERRLALQRLVVQH